MQRIAKYVSFLALAGSIVPAVLYLANAQTLGSVKLWMLVSTVVWFATAPLWMGRKPDAN